MENKQLVYLKALKKIINVVISLAKSDQNPEKNLEQDIFTYFQLIYVNDLVSQLSEDQKTELSKLLENRNGEERYKQIIAYISNRLERETIFNSAVSSIENVMKELVVITRKTISGEPKKEFERIVNGILTRL